MKNSSLSITRMARIVDQLLAGACMSAPFFQKSTQKLHDRNPIQQNPQLGVSRSTVFHTETVQIHTEIMQIHTETAQQRREPSLLPSR